MDDLATRISKDRVTFKNIANHLESFLSSKYDLKPCEIREIKGPPQNFIVEYNDTSDLVRIDFVWGVGNRHGRFSYARRVIMPEQQSDVAGILAISEIVPTLNRAAEYCDGEASLSYDENIYAVGERTYEWGEENFNPALIIQGELQESGLQNNPFVKLIESADNLIELITWRKGLKEKD